MPNVMLTAPAMKGMIGGRPSTHSVTTSDKMRGEDQRPRAGGNTIDAVHEEHRDQRTDLAEDVDGLRGIERKMPPPPVYGFNCHVPAIWAIPLQNPAPP